MSLTPDQERTKKREIELVNKDWEAYTPTSELRRKPKKGVWWLADKLWRRKHKLKTLYLWTAELFANINMMSYDVPLEHDNLVKPKSVPYMFALKNGWTIPDKDLKTLTHGPLFSETGEMLVKEGGIVSYYWNKVWPSIAVIATIFGLIRSIVWLFTLV